MLYLLTLLKSIPDVIWSDLIASALTLGGVLISNRSNTTRLIRQLAHDASQKSLERTATLRREIYLGFAEELVKTSMYLSCLPQSDLTKLGAGRELEGISISITRLQLVAEPKTALLALKLSAEYAELFMSLMKEVMPLAKAKTDIQISDDFYTKASNESWRLISERGKLAQSGRPDELAFNALGDAIASQQKLVDGFAENRGNAWKQFNGHTVTFQKRLLGEMRRLSAMQIPLLIEIRRDLGLKGELDVIEAFMNEQSNRMEAKFDELLASIEDA